MFNIVAVEWFSFHLQLSPVDLFVGDLSPNRHGMWEFLINPNPDGRGRSKVPLKFEQILLKIALKGH
jgi:hypothetical protein